VPSVSNTNTHAGHTQRERTEGKTAYAIARDLNKDAVPTEQGAHAWSQATVRTLLMREGVQ
jgi:Recombinase